MRIENWIFVFYVVVFSVSMICFYVFRHIEKRKQCPNCRTPVPDVLPIRLTGEVWCKACDSWYLPTWGQK
jgi:hypothetical protein